MSEYSCRRNIRFTRIAYLVLDRVVSVDRICIGEFKVENIICIPWVTWFL